MKKITEIRDDIFFRKLLDVSKNAVFIGWSNVYRPEYQSLLKENLPHLRELSIIKNAGFESTSVQVALYVFSEQVTDSYISRQYDGDKITLEQVFDKSQITDRVEYATESVDTKPQLSDFYKTVKDYTEWEMRQADNAVLQRILDYEAGKLPFEQVFGANKKPASAMVFKQYLATVQKELSTTDLFGDTGLLKNILANIDTLNTLRPKIEQFIRIYEKDYCA